MSYPVAWHAGCVKHMMMCLIKARLVLIDRARWCITESLLIDNAVVIWDESWIEERKKLWVYKNRNVISV
ncbi:hypothetical protein GCM10008014_55070 [Paenibacillus silvae]|uniref:Uncharacterized protein n=1 Tax=Paenibacillus silvae TaxID=1325358 RepID=A0ABQ1ZMJ8_9BACL|nr:hypothetical protein GCM10008014_55070 [Paenibacillus silvae]